MALAMTRPWKHPKTGIYWLRKRVPDDLRPLIGKLEHKQSLKTKDPADAKRLHAAKLAELESHWQALRRPGPPAPALTSLSEREAHERAAWLYGYWLNLHKDDPSAQTLWKTRLYDRLWRQELSSTLAASRQDMDEWLAIAEMRSWCRRQAETVVIARDLDLDKASLIKLEKAIAAAAQRASLVLEKWAQGDFTGTAPPSPQVAQPLATPAAPSLDFDFLLAGWEAERKPAPKTVYEYKRVVRDLRAFLGHDDPGRLVAADLVRWKAHLIAAGLHAKTIKDAKLAPIRAVLQWGVDNHHLGVNPGARITMDVKRRAGEGRRGFTEDEAILILAAATREQDPAKRWVPLLGAYSGARIAELSQLRAEDIVTVDGIPCMRITPDAGSLKTISSERVVPLHPAVIDAGFLNFVATSRSGPLFPSLKPDVFGSRGGNGTKIIGRWVRALGVDDERISPSHSWRHRFKTLARKHGLAVDISDAITGHSGKTVADRYGEFPVEALYRELLKIPITQFEAAAFRRARCAGESACRPLRPRVRKFTRHLLPG